MWLTLRPPSRRRARAQGGIWRRTTGPLFGAGSAFVVRLFNQNGTTPTTQLAAPVTKIAGSWYHIVLTYDGTTATLYEDGVAVTNNTAAIVPNVDAATTFGVRSDLGYPWPGQQAEVAMYSTALSAAQVAAHYNAATTAANYNAKVSLDAPVLWYQFLEPPDAIAANSAPTGSSLNGPVPVRHHTRPSRPKVTHLSWLRDGQQCRAGSWKRWKQPRCRRVTPGLQFQHEYRDHLGMGEYPGGFAGLLRALSCVTREPLIRGLS